MDVFAVGSDVGTKSIMQVFLLVLRTSGLWANQSKLDEDSKSESAPFQNNNPEITFSLVICGSRRLKSSWPRSASPPSVLLQGSLETSQTHAGYVQSQKRKINSLVSLETVSDSNLMECKRRLSVSGVFFFNTKTISEGCPQTINHCDGKLPDVEILTPLPVLYVGCGPRDFVTREIVEGREVGVGLQY